MLIRFAVAAAMIAGATATAQSQQYPTKLITIVVPFPPGGSVDILARHFGAELSKSLGQPVIIDNKPGAGGTIGTNTVAKAPADGYRITIAIPSHVTNYFLQKSQPYDARQDFVGIAKIAVAPVLLIAHPSVPVENTKDFIALAKKKPGQLSFSSSGVASGTHLVMEMFLKAAAIEMLHVPYGGGAAAISAVSRGEVDSAFLSYIQSAPFMGEGKLKALATSGAKRLPALPAVPTIAESAGLNDFASDTWYGFLARTGTPEPILDKLNAEFNRIGKLPQIQELMTSFGIASAEESRAEFNAYLDSEYKIWGDLLKTFKFKIE